MDPTQYESMAKRLEQVALDVDRQVNTISCIFNLPTHIVYNILIDVLRLSPGATEED